MNVTNDRMRQIEAEMARFENEISGRSLARLPGSSFQTNPVGFMPHALQRQSVPMNQLMLHPMQRAFPQSGSGPIIEGAPTRYLPPGAVAASKGSPSGASTSNASKKKRDTSGAVMMAPPSLDLNAMSAPVTFQTQVLPADVEALEIKKKQEAAFKNSYIGQVLSGKKKPKRFMRTGGGTSWEDSSLAEWDPNDFRLFCGDLGNEVSDELLAKAFRKYPTFQKAKVVRDKRTNKTKGFGFVSFTDPQDFMRAMREMNGKYVGNRPIKLRKSTWKERNMDTVKKKSKEKHKLGMKS